VKNNYEKSSNGEGYIRKVDDSLDFEQMDGSDKKNFLRGRSPATLYLWQKAEEFDLLDAITQQLDDSVEMDLSSSDVSECIKKENFEARKKLC